MTRKIQIRFHSTSVCWPHSKNSSILQCLKNVFPIFQANFTVERVQLNKQNIIRANRRSIKLTRNGTKPDQVVKRSLSQFFFDFIFIPLLWYLDYNTLLFWFHIINVQIYRFYCKKLCLMYNICFVLCGLFNMPL